MQIYQIGLIFFSVKRKLIRFFYILGLKGFDGRPGIFGQIGEKGSMYKFTIGK